jgi:hypothetical protein
MKPGKNWQSSFICLSLDAVHCKGNDKRNPRYNLEISGYERNQRGLLQIICDTMIRTKITPTVITRFEVFTDNIPSITNSSFAEKRKHHQQIIMKKIDNWMLDVFEHLWHANANRYTGEMQL